MSKPRHLKLLDLADDDCRFPYGERDYTFCGAKKITGSSYCLDHSAICERRSYHAAEVTA